MELRPRIRRVLAELEVEEDARVGVRGEGADDVLEVGRVDVLVEEAALQRRESNSSG